MILCGGLACVFVNALGGGLYYHMLARAIGRVSASVH